MATQVSRAPVLSVVPSFSLSERQATRLGALSNVDATFLEGRSAAELVADSRSRVEPALLRPNTIGGRVVAVTPTGIEGVAGVTIRVESAEHQLVGFFPGGWPWAWYFPLRSSFEVVCEETTDAAGRFTARVPRFDLDWIDRWHLGDVRFVDLFQRVELTDIEPDAGGPTVGGSRFPIRSRLLESDLVRRARTRSGALEARFGAGAVARRAFADELPPPIGADLLRPRDRMSSRRDAGASTLLERLAVRLNVTAAQLDGFDPARAFGPFRRSPGLELPEWLLLTDVPDLSFRVSNADGPLYDGGFFDGAWSPGTHAEVELCVEPRRGSVPANAPDAREPSTFRLQAEPVHHGTPSRPVTRDDTRQNRQPATGAPAKQPAYDDHTPFTGALQLYGTVRVPGARYYRVLRDHDDGIEPFTGLSWPTYRVQNGRLEVRWPVCDADGWYPIVPTEDHWFPNSLLLELPPERRGSHLVRLQCADEHKEPLGTPSSRALRIEIPESRISFHQLAWKFASESDDRLLTADRNLLVPRPIINRGTSDEAIQVMMRVTASAEEFRYTSIGASGCGNGEFALVADPRNRTSHWYASANEHDRMLQGRFELPVSGSEGAYSFNVYASHRSSGVVTASDGQVVDRQIEPVPLYVSPTVPVAIVE